jgi:hypothetical protein
MKMRTMIGLLSLFFSSTVAFAKGGNGVGNGGSAWVCPGEWVKLMDLFEAETEFHYPPRKFDGKSAEEISTVIFKEMELIFPKIHAEFLQLKKWKERVWTPVPRTQMQLESIPDAKYRVRPSASSCRSKIQLVQIGNRTEDGRLLVDQDILNDPLFKKDPKVLVAFEQHEMWYEFFFAHYGDLDSVRARYVVGILFSNLSEDEKFFEITKNFHQYVSPQSLRGEFKESDEGRNRVELLQVKKRVAVELLPFFERFRLPDLKPRPIIENDMQITADYLSYENSIFFWNKRVQTDARVDVALFMKHVLENRFLPAADLKELKRIMLGRTWHCTAFNVEGAKDPNGEWMSFFSLARFKNVFMNNFRFSEVKALPVGLADGSKERSSLLVKNSGFSEYQEMTLSREGLRGEVVSLGKFRGKAVLKAVNESFLLGVLELGLVDDAEFTQYVGLGCVPEID